ncbi:MAG: hypothetical protein JWR24_651 [Actinoallomurus sp.]|nr:hypothetical protein [Actinoallomurus sp.]
MRTSNFPARIALGLALAGAGTLTANPAGAGATFRPLPQPALSIAHSGPPGGMGAAALRRAARTLRLTGRPVPPAAFASTKWGVILRNTTGEPTAALRGGPYSRSGPSSLAATIPPPYGVGSLGILVGSFAEKIDFGNETIFAGLPLRTINVLKYWIYVGEDTPSVTGLPGISIESNPRAFGVGYTSLNYVPALSTPPSRPTTVLSNTWQQYDASGAGSGWFPTNGTLQTATGCNQITPCSFSVIKSKLPDAIVSLSIGISVGRNAIFAGAVDGLQINHTVYDFEPSGVRRTIPRPL